MKFNFISVLFIIVFALPIIKGFLEKFNSENLKNDIVEIEKSISFMLCLILGIYICRRVFIQSDLNAYSFIPKWFIEIFDHNPTMIYVILLPIVMIILYKIIFFTIVMINTVTFYPLLDSVEKAFRNKGQGFRRIFGAIFQVPRGICYGLLLAFILHFLSVVNISGNLNSYLEKSEVYNYICAQFVIPVTNSKLARQLPQIINNSFKVEVKQNQNVSIKDKNPKGKTIVYYNGVTLEEGVQSDKDIDSFTKKLVQDYKTDKSKARAIYNWIGSNIDYDYDKANRVLNNDFSVNSGAISAFSTKKGICFDYSCLYVAMSKAAGLKVRLVTGEGFNGISWVSHAWNQVYISEEDKWINVDATFYKGGNYFNSKKFDVDHKEENIIGEW